MALGFGRFRSALDDSEYAAKVKNHHINLSILLLKDELSALPKFTFSGVISPVESGTWHREMRNMPDQEAEGTNLSSGSKYSEICL